MSTMPLPVVGISNAGAQLLMQIAMDGSAFTDLVSSAVAGSGAALIADGLKLPKLSPAEHDRLKTQQIKAIMLASKLAEHHHTRLRASVKAMMELAGVSNIGGDRHKRAVRAFGTQFDRIAVIIQQVGSHDGRPGQSFYAPGYT